MYRYRFVIGSLSVRLRSTTSSVIGSFTGRLCFIFGSFLGDGLSFGTRVQNRCWARSKVRLGWACFWRDVFRRRVTGESLGVKIRRGGSGGVGREK